VYFKTDETKGKDVYSRSYGNFTHFVSVMVEEMKSPPPSRAYFWISLYNYSL
jgi:hypothetical protein